jgi:uncharacterized membrane protein
MMRKIRSIHIEVVFTITALVFGLFTIVALPPFQAPDEWNHFFRAYHVSEGNILAQKDIQTGSVGANLPKNLLITMLCVFYGIPHEPQYMPDLKAAIASGRTTNEVLNPFTPEKRANRLQVMKSLFSIKLNPEGRAFISFANTARFSPAAYLPQAMGIALGRVVDASPVTLLYLSRLGNLLVWLLLVLMTIRITPVLKEMFFLVALLPSNILQVSSASADAMTNGLSFLFAALILKLALDPEARVRVGSIVPLGLLASLLAITKFYIAIPLGALMIPHKKAGGKKRLLIMVTILLLAAFASAGLWLLATRGVIVPLKQNIDASMQARQMLADPFGFAGVLWSTFTQNGLIYLGEFVGQMGHFPIRLPSVLLVGGWVTILFAAIFLNDGLTLPKPLQREVALCTFGISTAIFVVLSYLTWTPVGATEIIGIQGRYFIPLAPFLFMTLPLRKAAIQASWPRVALLLYPAISLSWALTVLVAQYYGS